ncbi:uncharacterized protein [Watersipora subatra]|uniref:uncharacterized protein n=1 Tax=Watersipora subatra TaxID=2589382 RepID=UPI00355C5AEB
MNDCAACYKSVKPYKEGLAAASGLRRCLKEEDLSTAIGYTGKEECWMIDGSLHCYYDSNTVSNPFSDKKWTVVKLKRHCSDHKLAITGKRNQLIDRCHRHSLKCYCTSVVAGSKEDEVATLPHSLSSLNDSLLSLTWTDSFSEWPSYTHNTLLKYKASDKHLKQGYNLFKHDKVENMLVAKDADFFYCKGRVSPSMKKQRYLASVKLDKVQVLVSDCTCAAGKGKCKHAMALLYSLVDHLMSGLKVIPEDLACTSQPRQWGRVNAKPVSAAAVASFSDLAPLTVDYDPDDPAAATRQAQRAKKKLQYSCLHEDAEPMTSKRLKGLTGGHQFWTKIVEGSIMRHYKYKESEVSEHDGGSSTDSDNEMTPTPDSVIHIAHNIETEKEEPSTEKVMIEQDRFELERQTRGQGNNKLWMEARRGLITASLVGQIYALRETTSRQATIDTIMQQNIQDLQHIPAIKHGKTHEKLAISHYKLLTGFKVEERGLMKHSVHKWLGASVDGLISQPVAKCLEIKCPLLGSKDQKGAKIIDLVKQRKSWFLTLDAKNNIKLRQNHKYFYQTQIQMACWEVDKCDFLVYLCSSDGSFIDSHLESISFDCNLVDKLVAKCKAFYDSYITELL